MNDRKKDGAKDGTMKDASSAAVKRLPFTDDWMFGMVMRDPEICRELLERILPDEQVSEIQFADPDSGLAGKALAVSYTHLDVYKRQALRRSTRPPPAPRS